MWFSYLIHHAGRIGITFLHPTVLILLLAGFLFGRWPQHGSRWSRRFRVAAFATLVLVLAALRVTVRMPEQRMTVVAIVDMSASIDAEGRSWMQTYLNDIVGALPPGDELGVVTFAGEAAVAFAPRPPGPIDSLPPPASGSATDIARAIVTATALLPAEGERRLLLLSDGNQTRGDAASEAHPLRSAGIRLDAVIPPTGSHDDVVVDKLVFAPTVALGAAFPLRVVAYNRGAGRAAVFKLSFDGRMVQSALIDLVPGLNAIEIPYVVSVRGSHRIRVEIDSPGDPIHANNQLDAPIMVTGKTRVLLLSPHPRSVLAQVLARNEMDLDVRLPGQIPTTLAALTQYQCVALEDVSADELHGRSLLALESYVAEFGGGLIVVGGARTFGDPRFRSTPLQRLLPVTLEPHRPSRRAREPLALFIVIDRSNSMGYNSRLRTLRDGEKLRYAKEAAISVVRQLKDEDLVGVTVFDSEAHPVVPLRPLRENRGRLESDLPRLVEYGGTDFFDALTQAHDELAAARVNRRHVILLTDGDTNRAAADHYPLIQQFADAKISITTIRIGDDDVNLKLLRDISERTGGQFHHVEDVAVLPDLMLRDTTMAMQSAPDGEKLLPQTGDPSEVLREIDPARVPALAGYAYAKAKPGATLPLYVARLDRHDPILAVWQYGLGRVGAFTASPDDDAETWPAWDEYGKFWSQLVRWSVAAATAADYVIHVARHEDGTDITVRSFGSGPEESVLAARLQVAEGDTREVSLVPQGPRLFTARLSDLPGGQYPLTIIKGSGARAVSQRTEIITVPEGEDASSDEYRSHGPNLPLLASLAEQTGGKLNASVADVTERPPGSHSAEYPVDNFLLPLVMILFLSDVALRRLG